MSDSPGDSRNVEAAFYAAFVQRDLSAMQAIWADSPDVTCIHPGGPLLRGTADIVRSWAEILTNAAQPDVQYTELQRILDGDTAIHVVEERIRPARSGTDPTRVISTNVYRRTADGWRMFMHHSSLPLVSAKKSGPSLH